MPHCWTRIRRLGYVSCTVSRPYSSGCPRTEHAFPRMHCLPCVALAMADQHDPDVVGATSPLRSGLVSVLVTSYPPSHMVARGSRPGPLRPSIPLRSMGAARITLQISKRYSEPTGRSRARRRGRPRQPHHQDGSSRQSLQRTPPTRNRSGRTHHTGSRLTSISSTQTIITPKCLHRSSQASTR